jgi:hypothetical protein
LTTPSFRCAPGAEVFATLAEQTVNMAIWTRPADSVVQNWLSELLPTMTTADTVMPAERDAFDGLELVRTLPDHPLKQRLADDTAHLTRMLVHAIPRDLRHGSRLHVKSSFGPVRDDQCRKFHVDWVVLRLLTTWVGPGTEWLDDGDVDRRHVGASACCPVDANKAIVRRPDAIRRASAGEVLMMKGEKWPGNEGRGVVHRSPPLEGLAGPGMPTPARVVFVATVVAEPITRPTGRPKKALGG